MQKYLCGSWKNFYPFLKINCRGNQNYLRLLPANADKFQAIAVGKKSASKNPSFKIDSETIITYENVVNF